MKQEQLTQKKAYQERVKNSLPKSPLLMNCLCAFLVGGIICMVGQAVSDFGRSVLQLDQEAGGTFTSIVMVFLGAFLTGIGIYDKIGKFGGAGATVPITGFSNSIVASAIEYRTEGFVLGVGGKMFTIAGPVLVYGISTSIVVGLLYLAMQ